MRGIGRVVPRSASHGPDRRTHQEVHRRSAGRAGVPHDRTGHATAPEQSSQPRSTGDETRAAASALKAWWWR